MTLDELKDKWEPRLPELFKDMGPADQKFIIKMMIEEFDTDGFRIFFKVFYVSHDAQGLHSLHCMLNIYDYYVTTVSKSFTVFELMCQSIKLADLRLSKMLGELK